MKTNKLWLAGLLLIATNYVNGQVIEGIQETGTGLQNGAAMDASQPGGAAFFGYRAGFNTRIKDVSGANNTFIGSESGLTNTTGYSNTFLGSLSGYSNFNGYENIFLGHNAGFSNAGGFSNVFIGNSSGYANTSGDYNTFVGWNSGLNNSSANYNTFFGAGAGQAAGLHNNTYIGYYAGNKATGTNNTFSGYYSGGNAVNTAHNNTFYGFGSGYSNTSGAENVLMGANAGRANTSHGGNVLVGFNSGFNNVGGGNTYLGWGTGFAATNATGNVFIGYSAGFNESGSNKLYVANTNTTTPLIYGDFSNKKLVFNGKVGITNEVLGDQANLFPTMAGNVNVSTYQLFVKGGILTEEVRIHLKASGGWADYVFAEDYKLPSLSEVEKFITANGHLPNVPSAKQVKEEGIELGQMANIQQEKIEELTLYVIEQNKQLEQQQKEIDELKAAVKALAQKQ